jgi:predicted GIY-YIG superfamily endonuclease
MPAFIYILRCADDTYYVGHTTDLEARLNLHNSGHGPAYTRTRRPVELIYSESFPAIADAVRREAQVKRWSAQKKRALAEGARDTLKTLSRRRGR